MERDASGLSMVALDDAAQHLTAGCVAVSRILGGAFRDLKAKRLVWAAGAAGSNRARPTAPDETHRALAREGDAGAPVSSPSEIPAA
jgi:hypothetical protein